MRWILLLTIVLIPGAVFHLYEVTAALAGLLGVSLLCVILFGVRSHRTDDRADRARLITQEKQRDALKRFWAEKLRKKPQIARIMNYHGVGEADLDDYLELISCGWPLEEVARVMQDPRVFEYYFTHQEQTKWEILKRLHQIHGSGGGAGERVQPLKKQSSR